MEKNFEASHFIYTFSILVCNNLSAPVIAKELKLVRKTINNYSENKA